MQEEMPRSGSAQRSSLATPQARAGERAETLCPHCRGGNPPQARACMWCGQPLGTQPQSAAQPVPAAPDIAKAAPRPRTWFGRHPLLTTSLALLVLALLPWLLGRVGSMPRPLPEWATRQYADPDRRALARALGESAPAVAVRDIILSTTLAVVEFDVGDGYSEAYIRDRARREVVALLRGVRRSGVDRSSVSIRGYAPLQDAYGNTSTEQVINLLYDAPTLERINFSSVDPDDIYLLADLSDVHPLFR